MGKYIDGRRRATSVNVNRLRVRRPSERLLFYTSGPQRIYRPQDEFCRKEFRSADFRRCNVDEGSSMALVVAHVSGLVNPELLLQLDYLPPRIGSIAHICQIAYCAMQKALDASRALQTMR